MSSGRVGFPTPALRPQFRRVGRVLEARSSRVTRALSLFAFDRTLRVDGDTRVLTIIDRRWWFMRRTRRVPFERIAYVEYRYGSMGSAWGLTVRGIRRLDAVDVFSVSLALDRGGENLSLFTFVGSGAASTAEDTVLFGGGGPVDWHGDQEDASRRFVEELIALLGVPLGRPASSGVAGTEGRRCEGCGRRLVERSLRCLYCGADPRAGGVVVAGLDDGRSG